MGPRNLDDLAMHHELPTISLLPVSDLHPPILSLHIRRMTTSTYTTLYYGFDTIFLPSPPQKPPSRHHPCLMPADP